jgi:hypothetical protein
MLHPNPYRLLLFLLSSKGLRCCCNQWSDVQFCAGSDSTICLVCNLGKWTMQYTTNTVVKYLTKGAWNGRNLKCLELYGSIYSWSMTAAILKALCTCITLHLATGTLHSLLRILALKSHYISTWPLTCPYVVVATDTHNLLYIEKVQIKISQHPHCRSCSVVLDTLINSITVRSIQSPFHSSPF